MSRRFTLPSWQRIKATLFKEVTQMLRDRATLAMIIALPLIQLILFGYAINTNPKNLPTMIVAHKSTPIVQTITSAIQNTGYFHLLDSHAHEADANEALKTGRAQFVINFPTNFSRQIIRGQQPSLLVTADATDPTAVAFASSALAALPAQLTPKLANGALIGLKSKGPAFNVIIHGKYNPENISQYNIVPGLMGVVLTMTMIMITGQAITKERELGTMEMILATAATPFEVMLGKILPYILLGYGQVMVILGLAVFLFHVPFLGSFWLLLLLTLIFIAANLSVGLMFSTIAKTQLQSSQMTIFFFLPSILLSGFMFPFYGMPMWAQHIGSCLPLTHYLYIIRGIMLKGNGLAASWPHIWPMLVFMVVVILVSFKRYRRTLD